MAASRKWRRWHGGGMEVAWRWHGRGTEVAWSGTEVAWRSGIVIAVFWKHSAWQRRGNGTEGGKDGTEGGSMRA